MDVQEIYNDPIISKKRLGTDESPFRETTESILIERNHALLSEIPNRFTKVRVSGTSGFFYEIKNKELTTNTFRVDYTNGVVYFHESANGKTLTFKYLGEGAFYFPDSRIYLTGENQEGTARDKFADIDRGILEQRNRVDTLIRENPQPSEIVDIRVDYNGIVFNTARDRINSEQQKIEEAYEDAHGIIYNSLKERIDALQIVTGNDIDDITGKLTELESFISLVPGQIELKVSETRSDLEGQITSLSSTLTLVSEGIELKVSKDDVISSINLSSEGVRIDGNKHHITGETTIDNGVIKNAHIDSLNASKINAGTINTSLITIKDDNSNVQLNSSGILINKGAITIKGADGREFIANGMPKFEFSVFPVDPPYRSTNVVPYGTGWLQTESTTDQSINYYSFRHMGRYLKVYVLGGLSRAAYGNGAVSVNFIGTPSKQGIHVQKLVTNSYDDPDLNGHTLTIDMGVPTYEVGGFYVYIRTSRADNAMRVRIMRIWQEG